MATQESDSCDEESAEDAEEGDIYDEDLETEDPETEDPETKSEEDDADSCSHKKMYYALCRTRLVSQVAGFCLTANLL